MKYEEPEKLPKDTPDWFKTWYGNSYWHFCYDIKSQLALHNKLLWIILGAIIVTVVTNIFI